MIERTRISLEDWAKINNQSCEKQFDSIAQMLTQENEFLKDMGYLSDRESESLSIRLRNWIGHKLARMAFFIAPDVRDEYY